MNVVQSTTASPPAPRVAPAPLRSVPRPSSIAAISSDALLNWLESRIRPSVGAGVDQVLVPIQTPQGLRDLVLVVDRPMPYSVTCTDAQVMNALHAISRHDPSLLDDLLGGGLDPEWQPEPDVLSSFSRSWDDVPVMLWRMARVAERVLDRETQLPPATVMADASLATALAGAGYARMLATVGEILRALDRRVLSDVYGPWRRLGTLLERPVVEYVPKIGIRDGARGPWPVILQVIGHALGCVDQPNALAAWTEADAVLRAIASGEAYYYGANVYVAISPKCMPDPEDEDAVARRNMPIDELAARAAKAAHFGRIALGQAVLR